MKITVTLEREEYNALCEEFHENGCTSMSDIDLSIREIVHDNIGDLICDAAIIVEE